SRRYRETPLEGADGVVVQVQQICSSLSHHPVCAASDASRLFLNSAATPPGQEGRSARIRPSNFAKELLTQDSYPGLFRSLSIAIMQRDVPNRRSAISAMANR